MTSPIFDKLAIIGFGHIGSSIGRAARLHNAVKQLAVADNNAQHLRQAKKLKLADSYHLKSSDAVKGADLVIISTHLGAYEKVASQIAGSLAAGAIVSDVGSCKVGIFDILSKVLPSSCHIIPAHPVAGTEKSGPKAGLAALFESRHVIFCPPPRCNKQALAKLSRFWSGLGAEVDTLGPEEHDSLLALTSHLPHLLSYALVGSAAGFPIKSLGGAGAGKDRSDRIDTDQLARFSAGGFRDMTRIADSNPDMWVEVAIHNRDKLLEELSRFSEDLHILQKALRWKDRKFLSDWFFRTRRVRRQVVKMHQAGRYIATEKDID